MFDGADRSKPVRVVGDQLDHRYDYHRSRRAEQQRVTIWCRIGDGERSHDAASAGPVLDDKWLSKFFAQDLHAQACQQI